MREHYQGFAHVAVYTEDLEKSIAFYEKIGGKKLQEAVIHDGQVEKKLVLVDFAGTVVELIQPNMTIDTKTGNIPHFAIYVDNIDETVADMRKKGIDTFLTPEKVVQPDVFGGCENWFFTGPSGEEIELLKMM